MQKDGDGDGGIEMVGMMIMMVMMVMVMVMVMVMASIYILGNGSCYDHDCFVYLSFVCHIHFFFNSQI